MSHAKDHSAADSSTRTRAQWIPVLYLFIKMPEQAQLVAAEKQLSQISLPELHRPAVADDQEPTQELVSWSVRMYCYSLLAHFREMLRSFLFAVENGLIPSSFVTARCLFEMAAHAHYVHKHLTQYLDKSELIAAWELLKDINMGSRYMREEYGDEPATWPPFAAPREIAKVIRCFNEWSGADRATTEYSFLSEFTHPNMGALSHYYNIEPGKGGFGVVRFVDPPRRAEAAPWPDVSISLVSCLHFVLRMLQRDSEKEVSPQVGKILAEST